MYLLDGSAGSSRPRGFFFLDYHIFLSLNILLLFWFDSFRWVDDTVLTVLIEFRILDDFSFLDKSLLNSWLRYLLRTSTISYSLFGFRWFAHRIVNILFVFRWFKRKVYHTLLRISIRKSYLPFICISISPLVFNKTLGASISLFTWNLWLISIVGNIRSIRRSLIVDDWGEYRLRFYVDIGTGLYKFKASLFLLNFDFRSLLLGSIYSCIEEGWIIDKRISFDLLLLFHLLYI